MNAGLLGRIGMLVVVAGGSAGVTWAVVDHTPPPISAAGPAAWVDDPLDGSVLSADTGQLTVVAHATDPDGIDTVVLSVDGDEVDTTTAAPEQLVTARLRWTPPGPGTYHLAVVGRDPAGHPTPAGLATVQIGTGADQSTTTTTVPSSTTVPPDTTAGELAAGSTSSTSDTTSTTASTSSTTATSQPASTTTTTTRPTTTTTRPTTTTTRPTTTTTTRPTTTTTACTPSTPRNTAPADGTSTTSRTPTLQWAYSTCTPDQFQIELSRDPQFLRIETAGSVPGSSTSWTPGTLACGTQYYFHVRAVVGRSIGAWSTPTSFDVICRIA